MDGRISDRSESEEQIASHYAQGGLVERLFDALRSAGHDLDALRPDALSGFDEFHLGGRAATEALCAALDVDAEARVLDVGCGIGGPARVLARTSGCHVTGVDLTSEFVDVATELSARVGLTRQTTFRVSSALVLPFDDGAFDAAMMVHVGMNIANKPSLFAELARVVRGGGVVAIYDIMQAGSLSLDYPMPWATNESMSFLTPPVTYRDAMRAAGLTILEEVDHSSMVLETIESLAAQPPPLHLGHLMGKTWPTMFANLVAALERGQVAPVRVLARR